MDLELKKALETRFSEMLNAGIFSGGKEVLGFEKSVSEKLKVMHSIACANGTDALELALRALDISAGDEVIVPALTWVSTAEAVVAVGATTIFVDVEPSGGISSNWTNAISPKTKAVIPVHLFGKMVEMKSLMTQAKKHNIAVIEDNAQAFGAHSEGKYAGSMGDIGCLSFYPTKNLGALGEAGMCLTNSEELAEKLRLLLNHGQSKRDQHELIGRNSRIDSIQAGFLQVMMSRWEEGQQIRKAHAAIYYDQLAEIEDIRLPEGIENPDHNAHLFVIQTSRRDELKDFLSDSGIGTAIHYPTILPDLPIFRTSGDFQNARKLSNEGLSLPLNPYLKKAECEFVCEKIIEFFDR